MNNKSNPISSTKSLTQLKKGRSKNPYQKAISVAKLAHSSTAPDKEKGSDQSKKNNYKGSYNSKGSRKKATKGSDQSKKRNEQKALRVSDSKRGLRAFLALTPQERRRRVSVTKKIRHLLQARHVAEDEDSPDEKPKSPLRYKRPIEKLAKKVFQKFH